MMRQNIVTSSSIVDDYIASMKKVLTEKQFGKVGIVFKIHQGFVVSVEEIRETAYKILDEDHDIQ